MAIIHKLKSIVKFGTITCLALSVVYWSNAEYSIRRKSEEKAERIYLDHKVMNHKNEILKIKNELPPSCDSKAKNYVYVKTHKTGSSTLQKILNKFRVENTNKVKSVPGGILGGYPAPFNANFMYINESIPTFYQDELKHKMVNVISGHMKFNKKEVAKLVPKDAKYVTILRHPFNQIPSTFNYYYTGRQKYCEIYQCLCSPFVELFHGKRDRTLEEFLQMPLSDINESLPMYFKARNFQAYDLGLDSMREDKEYIRKSAEKLNQEFDLVLITEHFDESLILLKKKLCMEWGDIAYVAANSRSYEKPNYTPEVIGNMKKLYYQDFYLYEYFNKTLWEKVDKYGRSRMDKDLETLNMIKKNSRQVKKKSKRRKRSLPYQHKTHLGPYIHTEDRAFDIVQRMKIREKAMGNIIPKNFNFDEFGNYVAKYFVPCKVTTDPNN